MRTQYHTYTSKTKSEEVISLKELIKNFLINSFIFLLGILIFTFTVGIAYNTYLLIKLKTEKNSLITENKTLKKEYQFLTSQEMVLKKARTLGLYPPQEQDIIKLR